MKKSFFATIAVLFVPLFMYAQVSKIEGTWYNDEKTSTIEIIKGTDGKYSGKITWLETPNEDGKPKVDKENPDPKLAKRPLLGTPIRRFLTVCCSAPLFHPSPRYRIARQSSPRRPPVTRRGTPA